MFIKSSELMTLLEAQSEFGNKLSVVTEFIKKFSQFVSGDTGEIDPSFEMPELYDQKFKELGVTREDLKSAKEAFDKLNK